MKTFALLAICLALTGCMRWVSTVGFETAQKLCGESKVIMVENFGIGKGGFTRYIATCDNNAKIIFTVKDR